MFYTLPSPRTKGSVSLELCLLRRRPIRTYRRASLTLAEVGQLLWAAQGITADGYLRTAPSAGALYPLEVYVVVGGLYHYRPDRHHLVLAKSGDLRSQLAQAALAQDCVRDGAITILFAAVYARTSVKYGQRAPRYVHMEAGHAAENVCLQATAMGLGTVTWAHFATIRSKRLRGYRQTRNPSTSCPLADSSVARF
jgi:SagB-type dehydrogenase family enzyme